MIRNGLLLSILSLFVFHSLHAQFRDGRIAVSYGIKAGATRSQISGLETTILSEPYYLNYTLKGKARYGWAAGGFVDYNPDGTKFVLGADFLYSQQGSDLDFNNSAQDFYYKMQFKYQYVNITPQVKFYPWADDERDPIYGFNVGLGVQLGFNVANEDIIYKSGGPGYLPAFGSDLEQQQQLRNVLKGKFNFGPTFSLGYKFASGFMIDARAFVGVTDVVETQSNSYNFIENKNTNLAFQLTLGYDFKLFGKD